MADTPRSTAEILALLADNTTGNISPQDLRDLMVSVHGVYGEIYTTDSASSIQSGITTTPVKLSGFEFNGQSSGITVDHTNDQMTVDIDGVYRCDFSCAWTGSKNTSYQIHLRKNGIEMHPGFHREIGGGASEATIAHAGFKGVLSLNAGDIMSIYAETDGSGDITLIDAQFVLQKIG